MLAVTVAVFNACSDAQARQRDPFAANRRYCYVAGNSHNTLGCFAADIDTWEHTRLEYLCDAEMRSEIAVLVCVGGDLIT